MVKDVFRDHVRSMTVVAMKNEVLCKLLCHNICCLIMSQLELGIEPLFWEKEAPGAEREPIKAEPLREPVAVVAPAPLTKAPPVWQGWDCAGA